MDLQGSASAAPAAAGKVGLGGGVETVLMAVVFLVVLRVELLRRFGDWGPGLGSGYTGIIKRFMKHCAPEVAGLVAVLTLAAALRARGDVDGFPEDDQAWAQIKVQWPMLLGADTLLSLQNMLRLTVWVSVILRDSGGPTPLSGEPTVLWLCSAAARVLLLARTSDFMLDGPLGGKIAASFEVAVLPVLLGVGRGAVRKAPLNALLLAAGTAAFAHRNRLRLAEGDELSDSLFIFAHCCDVLAALAFLLRTALTDGRPGAANVSVGFTHVIMPVQASLSAYYFLEGFLPDDSLVATGLPFEVLQIGNIAALGAYLGAAALHVAERLA